MTKKEKQLAKLPLRLAYRHEGIYWNCYVAPLDTMENARLIASIAIGAAQRSQAVRVCFHDLTKLVLSELLQEMYGTAPQFLEPVPESERSGNA